ncbi:unnamed protein product [Urochloa humidicola]
MAAMPPAARCMFPGNKEHRMAMTVPEFKRWLKQFDTDRDGRISRKELQEAIRRRGAWFSGMRALFAIRHADRNRNGFVDDSEIEGLIQFAESDLGFRITTDAAATGSPWPLAGGGVMGSPAAVHCPLYRSTAYMAY